MAASVTNCSDAGSGKIICPLRNLPAGTSAGLDVLVKTTGLTTGRHHRVGHHQLVERRRVTLAVWDLSVVIVVQSVNSAKAVAAPVIPVTSTKKPLSEAKASITLTLPTTKIPRPAGRTGRSQAGEAVALAGTTSTPPHRWR